MYYSFFDVPLLSKAHTLLSDSTKDHYKFDFGRTSYVINSPGRMTVLTDITTVGNQTDSQLSPP